MPSLYPKERGNLLVSVAFTLLASLSEASINLTVSPSGPVEANQTVTIQCSFESNPISALFFSTATTSRFCSLVAGQSGKCRSNTCSSTYTTTCPNDKTYRVEYPIPQSWNGKGVYCEALITSGIKSNQVNFSVIVLVTSVTLTPTQITVDAVKQITLTCQTDYCNPAANITWYKSSTSLTTPTTDTTDTDSNGLVRTTSILQYTGVAEDNGQQVYCRANNRPGKYVDSNKCILDIRYPPSSDPVITASPPGFRYNTETTVTLTCQLSGGNPVATLSWRCKNTDVLGTNASNSTTAVSVLSLVMDSSYNNQQCTCTVNHSLLTSPKSRSVSLTVFYPPSSEPVIIASPPGLQYNTGTKVTLTCELSGGNPVATLSWRCKNTVMVGTSGSNSTTAVSVLSLVMDSSYNNQQCTCTANHRLLTSPKSRSVSLTVFYPPSSDPVIIASPPGLQYNTGTRVTLTCELSGGNPVATLSWRCKNTDVVGNNGSNSTTAVSVLSLVMDSSYNNQQCTCTANHRLLTSPKSRSVSLTVFYNNVITSNWNQAYSIKEHERFQLVCEVDGNPLSNITWVFVRTNSVIKEFHNVKNSSLEISSANCLDYGTYEVLADNGMGSTASKAAKLSVNCTPRLVTTDSLTPTKIGTGNNDSLQIFVRILLFPPAIQTTWNFSRKTNESKVIRDSVDGYIITHRNGNVEQNTTLYKKNVNTEEFGNYILRVENEVGIFTKIYHVNSARSPLIPTNITLLCENSMSIKLSWISNFNGGDDQSFQISYSTDGYLTESYKVLKTNIDDKGNGRLHSYIPSIELQGSIWFTITASNNFGNTTSDAIHCNAVKLKTSAPESNVGGIIGGTFGGVVLAVLIVLLIFINRKYQIKCLERKPNSSGKKTEVSDNILETPGLRAETSAQYEELKQNSRDQENSYDAITSPNKNRTSGATYEDLQPQKEENKYEEFTNPKGGKESTYTNSKMLSTANVYVNMSFK